MNNIFRSNIMDIGDIVVRRSYGKDVTFKIIILNIKMERKILS